MQRRLLAILLFGLCGLLAGCDGSFDSIFGPKATPTPVPRPAATPKRGSWMWDKSRPTLLNQTPAPR